MILRVVALVVLACGGVVAAGQEIADPARIDLSEAAVQSDVVQTLSFGEKDGWWWSAGASAATDFGPLSEGGVYLGASRFVSTDVEIEGDVFVRGFVQDGQDAVGVNPQITFRWHFHRDDDAGWTAFVDGGIGILVSTDDVPENGTSLNFTPRGGIGLTARLSETSRFVAALRWSHISNGDTFGNDDNPGSDGLMLTLGVQWAMP